jgi:hypothetical protein
MQPKANMATKMVAVFPSARQCAEIPWCGKKSLGGAAAFHGYFGELQRAISRCISRGHEPHLSRGDHIAKLIGAIGPSAISLAVALGEEKARLPIVLQLLARRHNMAQRSASGVDF